MPRPISTVWEHFLVLCETDGKKHVTCCYCCSVQYKHAMANKLKKHLLKCNKCPNDVKNCYKQNKVPAILHSSSEATGAPPTSTSSTIAPSSSAMEPSAVTPLPSSSTFNSDASHNTTFTKQPMPLTTAEKSKRYREKLKRNNPEKYEELKKKSIERALKSYKRKVVGLTAEQREEQRKKWRALNNIKRYSQHTEQPTTSTSQKDIPNIQPEVRVTAAVQPDHYNQVSEEVVISDHSDFPEPVDDLVQVQIQQPPELYHAGREYPVSQPQPTRRRRRLRLNRTSQNSNSSTTILKQLEKNKTQAEKKMAAASLMIAEAANKIADASLMNAETNRMNAETNRKQLEIMKAIIDVLGQPGQPSSVRLRAEDSSKTENENTAFYPKCNTSGLQTLNEREGRNANKRQEPAERRCRARKRFRQTDSSSEADFSDDNDDDNEQSSNCHDEEPEIEVGPVEKVEPIDIEVKEHAHADPISLDVKTEPRGDEATYTRRILDYGNRY